MVEKIDSASDARTANNAVRHQYRVLSDDEKAMMTKLKDIGGEFIVTVESLPRKREYSLAVTKIEEAVMWAVKGLTA